MEYGALLLVFFLTSLWHGALAGFLIWGGLHSLALLVERITGLRNVRAFAVPRRALTLVFVIVAWVPFRALEVHTTVDIWQAMLGGPWDLISPVLFVTLTPFTLAALVVGALSFVMPSTRTGFQTVFGRSEPDTLSGFRWRTALVLVPLALVVTLAMVLQSDFSPFLYFQF